MIHERLARSRAAPVLDAPAAGRTSPASPLVETDLLAVTGISKTFGSNRVLHGVTLEVAPGEIHGFVGANGSGKSTLIKILSGYCDPDPGGRLWLHGEELSLPVPAEELRKRGLVFVHQDIALVDGLSVVDNFWVGRYLTGPGDRILWAKARKETVRRLESFGLDISPSADVADLSPVDRTILAVARAVDQMRESDTRGVIVLDEPTASLPAEEVDHLLETMTAVAADGNGVVFVSHRLNEVLKVTDRITVLREGELISTVATSSLDEVQLIELMVGQIHRTSRPDTRCVRQDGHSVLRSRGVTGTVVQGLEVDLDAGEVVGVTGLAGSGFEEVPYLLAGSEQGAQGTVEVDGKVVTLGGRSPKALVKAGVVLVPGDRIRAGSAVELSVRENVTLPRIVDFQVRGLLRRPLETKDTARRMMDLQVVLPSVESRMRELSGGNQQRAILAKWLACEPRVLLVHEPTQGVDVAAKEAIFEVLLNAAARGCAVLLASVEAADLARLCDRVLVLRDGLVEEELVGDEATKANILAATLRGTKRGVTE